jgi:carbamoyl-phosphate synthase large subunit
LLSVANREKRRALLLARELKRAGYTLMATRGTAHALAAAGLKVRTVNKLREGRPNILDHMRNGEVGLVINIPRGKSPHSDGFYIRAASAGHGIPCVTNMEVALALARALRETRPDDWEGLPLKEYGRSRQEVRDG